MSTTDLTPDLDALIAHWLVGLSVAVHEVLVGEESAGTAAGFGGLTGRRAGRVVELLGTVAALGDGGAG